MVKIRLGKGVNNHGHLEPSGGSDLFKEFFIENLRLLATISKSFKYYDKRSI
jgi:hypothetical protein